MNKRIIFITTALVGALGIIVLLGSRLDFCLFSVSCAKQAPIRFDRLENVSHIMPVAVIGSGPAGLSAALYGARLGLDTYVIMGNKPGGLLMDTTEVENMPGKLDATGPEIMTDMQKQVEHAGAHFVYDQVRSIDFMHYPYKIVTYDDKSYYALSVIIATGAKPRLPVVKGLDDYWAKGVSSCAVCDAPFFKNKEVIVIGGGDSAIEESIQLVKCKKVSIMVRKDKMRASNAMQERLKGYPNIQVVYNVEVHEIYGDDKKVQGVMVYNNKTKQTTKMPVDAVFIAIGHDPNTDFLKNNGAIALDHEGYIQLHGKTQQALRAGSRNVLPLVFAAGDVEDKRYRQAGVAAGSGIKAALELSEEFIKVGYDSMVAEKLKKRFVTVQDEEMMSHSLQEITDTTEFDSMINDGISFVDFYTMECPTCLQMLPAIQELAAEYPQLHFIKVNADEGEDIARQWSVFQVPALLIIKDGKMIGRRNKQLLSKAELREFIEKTIAQ